MAGGYAAAAAARARPCASRPCATAAWPSVPCVHAARRSSPAWCARSADMATVVYFRASAPSAHCAK
eukprot:2237876-Pleurochrysis_carterae.AAC.1